MCIVPTYKTAGRAFNYCKSLSVYCGSGPRPSLEGGSKKHEINMVTFDDYVFPDLFLHGKMGDMILLPERIGFCN